MAKIAFTSEGCARDVIRNYAPMDSALQQALTAFRQVKDYFIRRWQVHDSSLEKAGPTIHSPVPLAGRLKPCAAVFNYGFGSSGGGVPPWFRAKTPRTRRNAARLQHGMQA